MTSHFITYGDDKYINAKKRIVTEATNFGFDTVTAYGPDDLDGNFVEKFRAILKEEGGGGFWIWKIHIIRKKLSEIKMGDYLLYADAGCTINEKGKERYSEYINMLNTSKLGIISFQLPHPEKFWTTKELFKYFNVNLDSDIANTGQLLAGIILIKKNEHSIKLIDEWYKTVCNDPLLITNHYNSNKQIEGFIWTRHDQSIFSVIRKIYKTIVLPDETYPAPFGSENSLKYPFWATRIRD